jgi:thioredoxin reductase (NADPH)
MDRPTTGMVTTGAVVVGAGPVGLFQVFQLGLQGIAAHVIDALPHPGGQCVELYADKPIYDIPAVPVCTGRELTERLLQQIAPFKTPLHLQQEVVALQRQPNQRFHVTTASGQVFDCATVFIAAGVGAFAPRRVALDGLNALENRQVHYHAIAAERLTGQAVVVMGGDAAALEDALALAQAGTCASVTLLHRIDKFRVEPALEQALRTALAQGELQLVIGQPTGLECAGEHLTALEIAANDGSARLPLDALLPRLGLSPKLGPVADWGLAMERKQLCVSTETFATSEPGIFAVGDINTYPGKRKLIVCGFHEATLAAFAAAAVVRPEERVLLQYTTSSPRLHALLGVAPP